MIVYTARHLLSVASPPVVDAAIAVEQGRIASVGRRRDVLKSAAGSEIRDLGDAVIIPGPVNAHCHLEHARMRKSLPQEGDAIAWLGDLIDRQDREDDSKLREAVETAIQGMVSRGTAAVGDVARRDWIVASLARSALHAQVFLEISGLRVSEAETLLDCAASRLDAIESEPDVKAARGRVGVVLTPHSAILASSPLIKALAGRAIASGEPLSLSVAETEAETRLLHDGTGPLVDFLKSAGLWDDSWRAPGLSPVEALDRLGALSPRTLAIHCIHLAHQDLSKLQARGVTVVTCPRSNSWLGVGKTPVPKLLGSGIPVALGTDSLASAPDMDLLEEMAALRGEHPSLSPAAVLRMATLNGARALGFARDLGTIEAGKLAALAVIPLPDPSDDPLEVVTSGPEIVAPLGSARWEPAS